MRKELIQNLGLKGPGNKLLRIFYLNNQLILVE